MLCLKRYADSSVEIRDTRTGALVATVRVVEVSSKHGHVILGFDAAPHIQFLRDDAKQRAPLHLNNSDGDTCGNTKSK